MIASRAVLLALGSFVFFPSANAETRAFTSADGKLIAAELVSHDGSKVKLRRADGKEFEVDPAIFSSADQEYIKAWMAGIPAIVNYNFNITSTKKKVAGTTKNYGDKRVKNDLWSYVISVANRSEDTVSNLTFNYRVFFSNVADGEYSSSSEQARDQMLEGEAKLDAELGFNHTLEITTTPVQIDTVDYGGYGDRHKDELKGCLVRVIDQAGNVVHDWVSAETTMKGKSWDNTNPEETDKGGAVIIQ